MGHGQAVKHRWHTTPTVNTSADEDTDLVQQASVQKTGVDGGATHNGHTLHPELCCQELSDSGQIDPLSPCGDPGDVPAVQVL